MKLGEFRLSAGIPRAYLPPNSAQDVVVEYVLCHTAGGDACAVHALRGRVHRSQGVCVTAPRYCLRR